MVLMREEEQKGGSDDAFRDADVLLFLAFGFFLSYHHPHSTAFPHLGCTADYCVCVCVRAPARACVRVCERASVVPASGVEVLLLLLLVQGLCCVCLSFAERRIRRCSSITAGVLLSVQQC